MTALSPHDPAEVASSAPRRELHLNAFLYQSGHHEAAWRHPSSQPERIGDIDFYREVAQTAERGRLDALFFADSPASDPRALRFSALHALEPIVTLATVAAETSRLGLIATVSTTYSEPYNLARLLATLDHLSRGRAGWNIVTTAWPQAAGNFGQAALPPADERYDRAEEYLEAVSRLWDSWEPDALRLDRERGIYADPDRIRPAAFRGSHLSVAGPLNIPRSPQGRPVYVQAGSSNRGREFAARHAEAVFTAQQRIEPAQAFAEDIRARAAAFGRDPNRILILPGLSPIIGSTETEAKRIADEFNAAIIPEFGVPYIAEYAQVDVQALAAVGLDERVPESIFAERGDVTDNTVSRRQVLGDFVASTHATLRELLELNANARGHLVSVGTPEQVADVIERWFRAGAADGFNIMPPAYPAGLEVFVEQVVPELQRRGLFRTEYQGTTLREHYGLDQPSRPAEGSSR